LATRLTFISHAATEAQRLAAFPLDEALDEREISKICALGWSAPRAHQVWAGPERRVQQTAKALGLSAAVTGDLHDCDYGEWNGYALSEVQSRKPEDVAAWLADPSAAPHGGESIRELISRVGRWLDAQRDAGHTLAITHPAVIRGAIVYALEAQPRVFWRVDIEPLSLTDLRWNGRTWTVRCTGCSLPRAIDGGNYGQAIL
jgi:broad specificity phosphatase PhoE